MFNVPANALVALGAAATWGGGDFSGGMSVKAAGGTVRGALRILILAHASSLVALFAVVLVRGGHIPHGAPLAWGLSAGAAAALGLVAFYIALAQGAMGAAAAVSGLLAAAIPVVVSAMLEGAPGWLKAAGFVIAMIAIWFIAAGDTETKATNRRQMKLAIAGGVGFGIYFVGLERANPAGVFEPLMLCRIASIATCTSLLLVFRSATPDAPLSPAAKRWSYGVALLDTAGNLLFIAATRVGRLDVAAVLASLYPASTILLAAWLLHERPARRQFIGMLLALVAVVMITV